MTRGSRVFVFEYLSGGGVIDGDAAATALLLPQGLAMRDAIAPDLLLGDCDVTVAACYTTLAAPRHAAAVQARADEALLAFVARQAARHDAAWIVAPETGGCLAAFEQAVPSSRWLGCSGLAIAVASSKRAALQRLASHGITTPLALADEATRWVVKPDDGAGAVATRRHDDAAAAQADAAQRPEACLEPWVDGEALSLSLLAGPDSVEMLSINRQRIGVDAAGSVVYEGVDIAVLSRSDARWPMLAALARRIAVAVPGLAGFVGVDVVWHAQRGPVVIEINPRTTCAYVGLSARLGRNLAAEAVTLLCQEAVDG